MRVEKREGKLGSGEKGPEPPFFDPIHGLGMVCDPTRNCELWVFRNITHEDYFYHMHMMGWNAIHGRFTKIPKPVHPRVKREFREKHGYG